MSKGRDALSILQQYFGERVDPGKALALLFGKLESQNEVIGKLKHMLCAMAFDHGTLAGLIEISEEGNASPGWLLHSEAYDLLALPRCELRAEVIEPNQPPSVRLT